MAPRWIGDYQLLDLVGHGATGRVFRARRHGAGDDVAVKVLRGEFADDPSIRHRFLAEGRLLLSRRLPGAVRMIEVIDDAEHAAIVMEMVDGGTLRQLITDEAPIAPQRAAQTMLCVARSLAAAQVQGIVHGDIKPENVLLDLRSGTQVPVLTDFGLARVIEETVATQTTSQFLATPHYAAPEIHEGLPGGTAADVYAMGLILYELVSGRRPFQSATRLSEMRLHLTARPRRTGEFSDELWELVERCLAKDPDLRPSAARVQAALDVLLNRDLLDPVDATTLDRDTFIGLSAQARRRRLHRRHVVAAAAVGLTGVGLTSMAAGQLRTSRVRDALSLSLSPREWVHAPNVTS